MSNQVYAKLNAARIEFHQKKLKKSGRNTFSKYDYFELGDFLVPGLESFNAHGLCAVVSFTADVATMRIVCVEDGSEIIITSPMGSAQLKACHEVQNIGAVETFQRRYLWLAALEIVEHDGLDETSVSDDQEQTKPNKSKPNQKANSTKLDGPYASRSALDAAIKKFAADMGQVANHQEWYALKNASADLIAQAQRDRPEWWTTGKGMQKEFEPIASRIKKLEAWLDKEQGKGEFDDINEEDLA